MLLLRLACLHRSSARCFLVRSLVIYDGPGCEHRQAASSQFGLKQYRGALTVLLEVARCDLPATLSTRRTKRNDLQDGAFLVVQTPMRRVS
jgi:hypothetical protein